VAKCLFYCSFRSTPDTTAAVCSLSGKVSLHTCPRALFRELKHVFPGVDLEACLAVPTSQKADMELVAFGDTVETEKDRLLNSVRKRRPAGRGARRLGARGGRAVTGD